MTYFWKHPGFRKKNSGIPSYTYFFRASQEIFRHLVTVTQYDKKCGTFSWAACLRLCDIYLDKYPFYMGWLIWYIGRLLGTKQYLLGHGAGANGNDCIEKVTAPWQPTTKMYLPYDWHQEKSPNPIGHGIQSFIFFSILWDKIF